MFAKKIWNPLKEIFESIGITFDSDDLFFKYNPRSNNNFGNISYGMNIRREYSYAVPSEKIADAVKTMCIDTIGVVEIGAGLGYWAKYLSQFNIDVQAYDIIDDRVTYFNTEREFHTIKVGEAKSTKDHGDRALLLCWPPMSNMANEALKAFPGDYVIYVGEGDGGCCANDEFFQQLDQEWEEIFFNDEALNLPGIRSYEYIYKRTGHLKLENVPVEDNVDY